MYVLAPAAQKGIAVSMRGFEVIGMLDRLRDIPPEIYRTVEYEGESIRLHQYIDKCVGEISTTYEPYCRLSVELDERAPHGWFWLKDWTENKKFVGFLIERGVIERHPTESRLISNNLVATAARLKARTHNEA
jgi:hypothetical protein